MGLPELDLAGVLAALDRNGVEFVLIGGMAAVIHGSPFPTEDVDITPAQTPENLARLSAALTELGARVRAAGVEEPLPFAHDATSLAGAQVWNLHTSMGLLDIALVPSGTRGYDDLVRAAVEVELFGHRVKVASLGDIIRSKQAANRPKDQRVLPVLRELWSTRDQGGPLG